MDAAFSAVNKTTQRGVGQSQFLRYEKIEVMLMAIITIAFKVTKSISIAIMKTTYLLALGITTKKIQTLRRPKMVK